jgi:formylglycine-generating enzyme required for sulfatase activity
MDDNMDGNMILNAVKTGLDTGLRLLGINNQKETQTKQIEATKEVQLGQLELSKSAQELQRSQIVLARDTLENNRQMAAMRKDETMATLFVRMQELHASLEQKELDRSLTVQENEKNRQENEKNRALNKYLKHIELEAIAENQARQLAHTSQENSLNRALTVQENSLNRALTEAIETLKLSQQMTIHNDNLALQNLKLQMDEKLLILSKTMDGQNAIALARESYAIRMEELKEKRRIEKSPLNSLVCDLSELWSRLDDPCTILFIYSPPRLQFEPSQAVVAQTSNNFPPCQSLLEFDLTNFQLFYEQGDRPIQFKSREWVGKFFQGAFAIDSIYREIYDIPTLILENNIEDKHAFFYVNYWNQDFKQYKRIPLGAINWQDLGENMVTIFSLISRLWLGFIVDTHYLKYVPFNRRKMPLLPSLLPTLLQGASPEQQIPLIITVIKYYEGLYNDFAQSEPLLIPDMRLDMVLGLANLPSQIGAKEQLIAALQNWLQNHDITPSKVLNDLLDQVSEKLFPSDRPFVDKLNRCLKVLNINRGLDIATSCYQRGLSNSQAQQYLSAFADFSRVIDLNPQPYAYYQRAITSFYLKNYAEAIADLTKALEAIPHNIEYFGWRAGAYYQLGEYEKAIADYDSILRIDPHHSQTQESKKITLNALYQRGYDYYMAGEYEKAIADYDYILKVDPHHILAQNGKQTVTGALHQRERERQEAIKAEEERKQREEEARKKAEQERKQREEEARKKAELERKQREAETARKLAEEEERRRALIFPLPNNQTLELVWIPAGTLKMEGGHTIKLQEFRMGKYPITQAQYQAVMGNNPSCFSGSGKENHPVENLDWKMAKTFCQKLTEYLKKQGLNVKIDLPSETQWEYACRAHTTTKYWFGDNDNDLKTHAWYSDNSGSQTHSVKEAEATHTNPWGLVDMHGNVWEWCADEWTSNVKELPTDGSAYHGENENRSYSAIRGGSWCNHSNVCASALRLNLDARDYDYGFRVVCV